MKISTILDQIDMGAMALPEFQRGYVWGREQVRKLMASLYRRYPVGSLLVWVTQSENAPARGDATLKQGSVELILDGQQRITSLYGIIRGKPPAFFDGDARSFTGLYFNLETESFEFYMPSKMKDNPLWIDVTKLMIDNDVGKFLEPLLSSTDVQIRSQFNTYLTRLTQLVGIKEIELHAEKVTGADKTTDIVVDIFNQVNSGGTKLSKGDLALAKICAQWPDARDEMKRRLDKWHEQGFDFKLELFLRVINAILTGEALFAALDSVTTAQFREGLVDAEQSIDTLLDVIGSRLGLDHDRVLGSVYSLPVMSRYLVQRGGKFTNHRERDKMLFWYIHTLLWGRYGGSTESTLNQDLRAIREASEDSDIALNRLIEGLRRDRGDLRLRPADFEGWSRGARFYPFLYMMTRVWHTKDWGSGNELSNHLLGRLSSLQVHHIFPKAALYRYGYGKTEANAIANFTFLTQETNLAISDKLPEHYLEDYIAQHPGAVESHWIPMDQNLWTLERYPDFLAARRELLAEAANRFLDSLYAGEVPDVSDVAATSASEQQATRATREEIALSEEESVLRDLNTWLNTQSLASGEMFYELLDEQGKSLGMFDLAWPRGLQPGYSQPVALLIDEPKEVQDYANAAGFRYFTSVEAFKRYVAEEILVVEPAIVG